MIKTLKPLIIGRNYTERQIMMMMEKNKSVKLEESAYNHFHLELTKTGSNLLINKNKDIFTIMKRNETIHLLIPIGEQFYENIMKRTISH